jgi:hypothetical protein
MWPVARTAVVWRFIGATAQALVELAGDPALRRRLGAAANARFRERFTVAAVKAMFIALYNSLLSTRDRDAGTDVGANPVASQPLRG